MRPSYYPPYYHGIAPGQLHDRGRTSYPPGYHGADPGLSSRQWFPSPALYNPEMSGFWDVLKGIGGKLSKITPEQAAKAGEIVGAFRKGGKGKGGARTPMMPPPPPAAVPSGFLGIDTQTLLLLLGAVGLGIYLVMKK